MKGGGVGSGRFVTFGTYFKRFNLIAQLQLTWPESLHLPCSLVLHFNCGVRFGRFSGWMGANRSREHGFTILFKPTLRANEESLLFSHAAASTMAPFSLALKHQLAYERAGDIKVTITLPLGRGYMANKWNGRGSWVGHSINTKYDDQLLKLAQRYHFSTLCKTVIT